MWESIYEEGAVGSGGGIVLEDEVYAGACRITAEKCPDWYEITCGVYGAMVHTAFCSENYKATYEAMKQELQAFIDKDTTPEEEYQFYADFASRY